MKVHNKLTATCSHHQMDILLSLKSQNNVDVVHLMILFVTPCRLEGLVRSDLVLGAIGVTWDLYFHDRQSSCEYVALLYFIDSRITTIEIASRFWSISNFNSQISSNIDIHVMFQYSKKNLLTVQFYKSVDPVKDTNITYRKQATKHLKEPQAFNRQELPRRNWYVVLCSAGQPAIVADEIYVRCFMRWTAGGRLDRWSWEMHNQLRGQRTQEQCQH